jgi:hypothetical protein
MHDTGPISTPWLVAAAIAVVSTTYQVGFFAAIGPELISLASPVDWLFSVAVAAIPTLVVAALVGYLMSAIGEYQKRRRILVSDVMWWSLLTAAFFVLPFIVFGRARGFLFLILCMLILYAFVALILRYEALVKGEHSTSDFLVSAFIGLVISSFFAGNVAASLAGRSCEFKRTDGTPFTGEYLRSVSSGHIVRSEGKVHFLSSSIVSTFSCKEPFSLGRFYSTVALGRS